MEIINALKANGDLRLTNGNRWMYWNNNIWVVRTQEYRKRSTTVLCETDDLSFALKILNGYD